MSIRLERQRRELPAAKRLNPVSFCLRMGLVQELAFSARVDVSHEVNKVDVIWDMR